MSEMSWRHAQRLQIGCTLGYNIDGEYITLTAEGEGTTLIVHNDVAETRAKLIMWAGTLHDAMIIAETTGEVADPPQGCPLIGLKNGQACCRLTWLGGSAPLIIKDVKLLLSAMGVDDPRNWRATLQDVLEVRGGMENGNGHE